MQWLSELLHTISSLDYEAGAAASIVYGAHCGAIIVYGHCRQAMDLNDGLVSWVDLKMVLHSN